MCSQSILQFPDFTRPFIVTTDASNTVISGILSQGEVGKDLPISYASRLLNDAEQRYSTIERELLAIVYVVNYFRPYIYGQRFRLVTDDKLVWLHSVKDPTSRLVRWRLKLAEYDYEVTYKAGKINANADALSRNPPLEKILPISTDSDEPIFSPPPHKQRVVPTSPSENIENFDPREDSSEDDAWENPTNATSDSDHHSDISDTETTDDSDAPLFDPIDKTYHSNRAMITETRDNLHNRKDNIVVFITEQGDPCDNGARALQHQGTLPSFKNITIGRASVTKHKGKHVIALAMENKISAATQLENLKENIASLYDVTRKLGLKLITLSADPVLDIPADTVKTLLTRGFSDNPTQITICSNQVTTPPPRPRKKIEIA